MEQSTSVCCRGLFLFVLSGEKQASGTKQVLAAQTTAPSPAAEPLKLTWSLRTLEKELTRKTGEEVLSS